MNKEEELLIKRIQDLAKIADLKCMTTFSDFLNLNEQNILHQTLQKLKEEYRSSLAAPVA